MRKIFFYLGVFIIFIFIIQYYHLLPNIDFRQYVDLPKAISQTASGEKQTVVYEESVITKVVEDSLPSVVTIGISKSSPGGSFFEIDPFNPFSPFRQQSQQKNTEQNIGSGFVISKDGLVLTNKHVVSDSSATYQVITNDDKKYDVQKIYRDPLNDLAILKIGASNLKPLKLGSSSNLKLGQMAIAIGTPLGEFKNTVTVGIISGLGRGITAGSPYEGYVEKLDNVIQTDAAISPGNSGGPLLNSKGEAVGINTAIAEEGQNIGFAIPVNIVNSLIDKFKKQGGSFERPYLGIRYKAISKQTAVINDLAEGVYVVEVIQGSPADKAGIKVDDVITEFDGKKVTGNDDQSLAKLILEKKAGEKVKVKIFRESKIVELEVSLDATE